VKNWFLKPLLSNSTCTATTWMPAARAASAAPPPLPAMTPTPAAAAAAGTSSSYGLLQSAPGRGGCPHLLLLSAGAAAPPPATGPPLGAMLTLGDNEVGLYKLNLGCTVRIFRFPKA
jgi:hypothetical protein